MSEADWAQNNQHQEANDVACDLHVFIEGQSEQETDRGNSPKQGKR